MDGFDWTCLWGVFIHVHGCRIQCHRVHVRGTLVWRFLCRSGTDLSLFFFFGYPSMNLNI